MLTLKFLSKANKFKKSLCLMCEHLRYLSTEEVSLKENVQKSSRKFSKPVTTSNLQPMKGNFIRDLFCGTVYTDIFHYPAVLRSGDIDVVFNHTSELEQFLKNNIKTKLTEEVLEELRKLDLFGLSIPQKYGGAGYTHTEAKFLLECAGINPTLARFLSFQEDFACKVLELYGSEKQKQKYLPELAAGRSFMTLAYLEEGPLIDLSKFQGCAITVEDQKRIILNTEKKWVHCADKADLFLVMVKSSAFNSDTHEVKLKFSMVIVDRDTPGVTVYRVNSKNAQEFDLYDVSFKNVSVPFDNVLGDRQTDGFAALRTGLSHSHVTDAAICCCLVKRIINYCTEFIKEKGLCDITVRGNGLLLANLGSLSIDVFALESSIYLVTGRFDMYEKPDLFNESVLVKSLAVDILQTAIKSCMELVGRDGFKASGIIEEAMQSLHYFSVFDENIEYLKMLVAADGLVNAASILSHRISALRKPFENPANAIKRTLFSSDEANIKQLKSKQNFKMELPKELTDSADALETNCARLQSALESLFTAHGTRVMNNEHYVIKLADVSAYLFAWMACLARASNSVCYDFEGFENDLYIAQAFGCVADSKLNHLFNEEVKFAQLTECHRVLGKMTFNTKEFPAEHPLTRTY